MSENRLLDYQIIVKTELKCKKPIWAIIEQLRLHKVYHEMNGNQNKLDQVKEQITYCENLSKMSKAERDIIMYNDWEADEK